MSPDIPAEYDHDRIINLEKDLRALDTVYVRKEAFDGHKEIAEQRFREVEKDIAELKGGWTWLSRIIIAAVVLAVLGLVLVKP